MKSLGKKIVIEALGDSYYPDLGQSVKAEKVVALIDSNPLLAAAPDLLAALKDLVRRCDGPLGVMADGSNIDTRWAHAAIDKADPVSCEVCDDTFEVNGKPCQDCCDHSDRDGHCCLICDKDLTV